MGDLSICISKVSVSVSRLHQHRQTCQLHLSRPRGGHRAQLRGVTCQYFLMATVVSQEEHLAVELLNYVDLLKKDGMEEEANV